MCQTNHNPHLSSRWSQWGNDIFAELFFFKKSFYWENIPNVSGKSTKSYIFPSVHEVGGSPVSASAPRLSMQQESNMNNDLARFPTVI